MAELPYVWVFEFAAVVCFVAVFLPMVPHSKLRYYACYISYVVGLSVAGIGIIPILMMRPKNIDNLRICADTVKKLTHVIGIKWEIRNSQLLKEDRAAVIAANHQSIFDILGMFNIDDLMGKCTVVARKELLYIVPIGPIAWLSGVVFIDRQDTKTANATMFSRATDILHSLKMKFWVFPEGTRNKKGTELLPFKRGTFRIAIESRVPIIPIVYSPYYFINGEEKTFDTGKIIISVLKSIPTEGMTIDDIETLKDKTYRVMSLEYERLKREISEYRKSKTS